MFSKKKRGRGRIWFGKRGVFPRPLKYEEIGWCSSYTIIITAAFIKEKNSLSAIIMRKAYKGSNSKMSGKRGTKIATL